LHANTM